MQQSLTFQVTAQLSLPEEYGDGEVSFLNFFLCNSQPDLAHSPSSTIIVLLFLIVHNFSYIYKYKGSQCNIYLDANLFKSLCHFNSKILRLSESISLSSWLLLNAYANPHDLVKLSVSPVLQIDSQWSSRYVLFRRTKTGEPETFLNNKLTLAWPFSSL